MVSKLSNKHDYTESFPDGISLWATKSITKLCLTRFKPMLHFI